MPALEIIWSPTALEHLQAIYDDIPVDNPGAATHVHEVIERTAEHLQDNPRLGHPGRVVDIRERMAPTYTNYSIVYEIQDDRIHMLAVMRDRQHWPERFGENH